MRMFDPKLLRRTLDLLFGFQMYLGIGSCTLEFYLNRTTDLHCLDEPDSHPLVSTSNLHSSHNLAFHNHMMHILIFKKIDGEKIKLLNRISTV